MLKMASKSISYYKHITKDFIFYKDGDYSKLTPTQKEKMFGVLDELEYKEKDIYTAKPKWYIILPTSRFSIIWNMIIMFLLCYIATYLPYRIAFWDSTPIEWQVLDYMTDFLFKLTSLYIIILVIKYNMFCLKRQAIKI